MRKLFLYILVCSVFIFGISSGAYAVYTQIDLSPYVDTSFSNLINATSVPYPTGPNNLGSNLTGVPFNIANVGPTTNGYGLNFWGGWPFASPPPRDNGPPLALHA